MVVAVVVAVGLAVVVAEAVAVAVAVAVVVVVVVVVVVAVALARQGEVCSLLARLVRSPHPSIILIFILCMIPSPRLTPPLYRGSTRSAIG